MATTIEALHAGSGRGADLVRTADHAFERDDPYRGDAFRNHCLRLYGLADLLFEQDRADFDRSTLYAVSMFHDLGLVNESIAGPSYLRRSLALFEDEVGGLVAASARGVLEQCMLLNHRLRPVRGADRRAELYRRAVWVEHTRGLRRYGLPGSAVKAVFERHPRLDLDRVLLDFARRVVVREPLTLARGIFF